MQQNQPAGVPPLPLTGERTLPDVPEENYWYRRHLVVYEWIAARVGGHAGGRHGLRRGLRLRRARRAAPPSVVGVDANPEAHEHARLRYRAPQPALRARPGRELRRALRRGRLPADDRARPGPRRDPRALQVDAGAGRRRLRLDPEPADPGAARGGEVGQPLAREASTAPTSSGSSARRTSTGSRCSASSTPASCARTSWRSGSAGTRSTSALGLTKPFYDRFTPAISASDFALAGEATSTARWTSSPSAAMPG